MGKFGSSSVLGLILLFSAGMASQAKDIKIHNMQLKKPVKISHNGGLRVWQLLHKELNGINEHDDSMSIQIADGRVGTLTIYFEYGPDERTSIEIPLAGEIPESIEISRSGIGVYNKDWSYGIGGLKVGTDY
jgi:hypothetical protein